MPDVLPRIMCAWCGTLLRHGPEPTSHGICPACEVGWLARAGLPYAPEAEDEDVVQHPDPTRA